MTIRTKIAALAVGASALAFAAPSLAAGTVTGTVNVTGNVAAKCMVVPGADSTFSDTLAFGELSTSADGTLSPATSTQTVSFEVLCNSTNPSVTVSATPLKAQNNSAGGATGYSDTVDYLAEVTVQKATSGTAVFSYKTVDGTAALGEPSTGAVGDRLKAASGNLSVKASALATRGGAGNVLIADTSYKGVITITVSPS
ncbi:MAG: hypothetical protein JSR86_08380 [Proteobacteria bacterium]|nr:hypothetical protein [Pseudomonadota bacterium]